jgi:hypothetical protein
MLESMSSSQFSSWAAYFQHLAMDTSGTPKGERYAGSGRMTVRDWKRMSEDERKKESKRLYQMFRNNAVASGGLRRQ